METLHGTICRFPCSEENISGSPVCMRRDHPVSQPSRNCDSDGTIGSNRNSSPVSELDACSTDSEGDHPGPSSPEKEKLRLRKLVLQGILETERDYLTSLEVLLKYKKSLEAAAGSSQPVMSLEDIKVVFSKIPELHIIHEKFVHELAERVNESTPQQRVGDLFKMLISSFPVYSDYMKNYPKAVETIGRCSEENLQFRELANMVPIPNSKETLSLQNMLFKPVVRIQRNTLVLHDLINCTPKTHPDYEELLKAKQLTHLNLEEYGDSRQDRSSRKLEEQQHLVKNSFLVALEGGRRKLRYVFLFNDVIICTKQKISGRSQRHNFEVKWFASLTDILLTDHRIDQQGGDSNRESRISNMDEVEDLKKRVIALKTELRAEIKKAKENEGKEKSWSFASRSAAKAIEKQKKKLHELEAALVQASPNLPFKINHKSSGKSYVFLMSTDYEREEWSEAIIGNQAKVKTDLQSKPLTPYDIQMLIENVKQLPKVNRVGNALLRSTDGDDDNDGLSGVLNVTIHRLSGLTKPSDTFCCLELDSYGHFFMTARTNVCRGEKNPVWDEEFEIDLDGSQTLRILCYRRGNESEGDVLLGKSALELKTSWLEKFHEKEISLNEYSLMVSIRYVTAATTMKRLPSRLKTGVFGVKITNLVKREGRKIPTVVTACVDEIEKRGMDETGIYRVSGVTSDVQRLKKAFDKNSRGAMHLLSEFDIHAVSGVLKLYFRELPEPLFTEALYCNFIDSLALADAEAKEKCMLSLLHSLPDPSLRTVLYLIDHLIRVSHHQNENRMNLHNLATIFGPTLLRPAAKDPGTPTPDMLFLGAQEALSQTAVLHYFITLRVAGKDLNKPATKASKLI
ncbi:active breakpoint cluster region-related protein-like isoform X2 [Liolophura sinensis]|uniref:active breakpoint cluster region-related protein-like isoform X2 n=1 Tax=Liolophura sinensis TaxID=3198878 RepID=UPI003158D2C0